MNKRSLILVGLLVLLAVSLSGCGSTTIYWPYIGWGTPPQVEVVVTPTLEPVQAVAIGQPVSGKCQRLPDYNRPEQPQIGHPSVYAETGVVETPQCYVMPIKSGFVGVIGGAVVDGLSGGVYKTVAGPATITTTVVDGFVAITAEEIGQAEFCFRVGQAVQYGWGHKHVLPLPGWAECDFSVEVESAEPIAVSTAIPVKTAERRETGQEKALPFSEGEGVYGWRIVLDDGRTCDGGGCYFPSAPSAGTVTSGVINPWADEVKDAKVWQP